jgi:hypothetical protein
MEAIGNVKNYVKSNILNSTILKSTVLKSNISTFFLKSCLPIIFVTFKYGYRMYSLSNTLYKRTNYTVHHVVNNVVNSVLNKKSLKMHDNCDSAVCINERYYDSFKIHTYKIIKYKENNKSTSDWNNEWFEYIFDYIIKNDLDDNSEVNYDMFI